MNYLNASTPHCYTCHKNHGDLDSCLGNLSTDCTEKCEFESGQKVLEVRNELKKENFISKKEIERLCEEMKKTPDCAQNPNYPDDQCTPTCGYNQALTDLLHKIKE